MGGIKNKQSNKLSNKTVTKSSRLPSFSQPSEMLTRNTPNTRKSNWWSLYASKTIGSLRLVTLTKYLSITCLALAILSTIGLNIISSYSSSKVNSNAEPVSNSNANLSTLANGNDSSICDPSNTNAESCISLSITSSSSSTSTGGDDANLSLQIPREGGIATGRHTVTVNSNNYTGYYVTLTGNAGSPAMTPATATSQAFIQSTTGTLTNPSSLDKGQWGSWGIALPNSSLYTGFNTNEADYNSTNQDVLTKTTWAAVPGKESDDSDKTIIKTTASSKKTDSYPVYYGVRVDSPVSVPADTYAAQVVYTATTNEVPIPTITSINPNSYTLDGGASGQVTITGTNLLSAYEVYLTNANGDRIGECTNLSVIDNNNISYTTPTTGIAAGEYTIHVVTQGTDKNGVTIGFTYTKKSLPDGMLESTDDYGGDGHVAVDYDENLIPIKISSNRYGSPTITAIPKSEIDSDPGVWYDYSAEKKQWANAVTVKNPEDYKNITSETTITDSDILGYWVYIPRYAYKVMRRDASDRAVSDTTASRNGGFEIKFETASDPKKTPVKCSRTGQDYQTCVGTSALEYPTDPADKDKTAWATHPAFSWGTDADGYEEMNGFWIGKFETTNQNGSTVDGDITYPGYSSTPTVLPGYAALGLGYDDDLWSNVADMYDTAKKFGVEDKDNKYGYETSGSSGWPGGGGGYGETVSSMFKQNNQNLSMATSHMIKNNEWGATLYLASSKFGAGVNAVEPNMMSLNSYIYVTACGPNSMTTDNCRITNQDTVQASTTGNAYGVFDMVGGVFELVMGSYGRNNTTPSVTGFRTTPEPPYIQVYNMTSSSSCTWETCGGDASYETANSTILSYTSSSSSSSAPSPMWGDGMGMFTDSQYPLISRGLGKDLIGYGLVSQDSSAMYGIYPWSENLIQQYGRFALRVVLRNSSTDSTSGGDDNPSGDDKPQWNVNVTNVDPSQLHVVQLVTGDPRYFYLSGSGLNKVYRITLTGVQHPEFTQELTCYPESDTHSECNTREWDTNNGNPAQDYRATFYDYSGNVVYEMDVFVTIIGSL